MYNIWQNQLWLTVVCYLCIEIDETQVFRTKSTVSVSVFVIIKYNNVREVLKNQLLMVYNLAYSSNKKLTK